MISPSVKCELRFSRGGGGRAERWVESLEDIMEGQDEAERVRQDELVEN